MLDTSMSVLFQGNHVAGAISIIRVILHQVCSMNHNLIIEFITQNHLSTSCGIPLGEKMNTVGTMQLSLEFSLVSFFLCSIQ